MSDWFVRPAPAQMPAQPRSVSAAVEEALPEIDPTKPNPLGMSDAELLVKLRDPFWRLRNLYWIQDKDGHEVLFQPWQAQDRFFREIWFRNVIPKARQRGFSTGIQLLMLDTALFTSTWAGAVIAQDFPAVLRIFRTKIKFAYDRLPAVIKQMRPLKKKTESELIFSNDSNIYVAVSTRSGTLQFLHVSELGQITKKFPEKANEIQSGALPSVDKDGIIVVESTVESATGMFPDMVRTAQKHQLSGKRLSQMEYRLHFASWWDADEYEADPTDVAISSADLAYFSRVEALVGITLTARKRAWYVLQRDNGFLGDWEKMKSQYPSFLDEAFEVSMEGLWLGQQMARVRSEGRIGRLPYHPDRPVHFFWDIGRHDDNAIWAGQEDGPWMNWLAFFEASGEPYAYSIRQINEWGNPLGIIWGQTWLPHDADQRAPGAEHLRTSRDMIEGLGVRNVDVVPRTADLVDGGIEDLRAAMSLYRFDEVGCKEGIAHLDGYAKVWNERMGLWSAIVAKNGHQHSADALRQHAQIRHVFNGRTGIKKTKARATRGTVA